ncbi:DUF4160 domain-containing protein [Porifericola rhodea]|uniref:DUF4160 domain-containing protein n=1 Tax=Porifericola rhodea TaxID=930972 RepID=UPI0026651A50|nr:DUF4160 domain-containing protein [Porifericola rhodea]WKN32117.1 DUF4160 domain-containing protein [Porifericola rhodea]
MIKKGFSLLQTSSKTGKLTPIHIHVKGKGGSARYELEPEIKLTDSKGLKTKELRQIEKLISQRRGQLVAAWHQYFKE